MLLDTGADVSLIKLHCLADDTLIDDSVRIDLQGIHETPVTTIGQTTLTLELGKSSYEFVFHVVPKDFTLRTDGVIGRNLLVKLKATIDYGDRILRIGVNKIPLSNNVIKVPPKTEKVAHILVDKTGLGLIEEFEVESGVFVPNTIVEARQGKAQIVVINTSNHEVDITNLKGILQKVEINKSQIMTDNVSTHLKIDHLSHNEKSVISNICQEYRDIFYLPGDKLTCTKSAEHEIPLLKDTPPVHVKPYRIPHAQKEEVTKQVDKLLKDDIIRPSSSPYNAPIVLVPKKMDNSGKQKWRMAVDMRRLNDVTIGDSYPLPNITEIIDQLGNSKYYTALDLAAGYYQIPVKEGDKQKTAFSTSDGHYEFNCMPFGAKGAPAVFQRLMNKVLAGLIGNICLVYLDDIVVYSNSIEEHEDKLRQVFDRLRQHTLLLQPDKCNFLMTEIKYLGHIINGQGVAPDPDKVKAVREYPLPRTPKQIKSFLGLIGYYRKFISHFATKAKPLNNLLRKDVTFKWGKEEQDAFESLKREITNEPVLIYPDFNKEFILTTDASKIAIGAILSQGSIGQDRPIAFASRTLNKAESNYTTTEQELLAIVWATKHFRPYLYGRHFKIVTDHKPLKWLFSIKDPGSRLMRWRLKLEEYDYEITYKAGKMNVNADALSRVQISKIEGEEKYERDKNQLKLKLHRDETGEYRHLITDDQEKRQLLKEYHDNPLGGHQGHHRTLNALKLKYCWPNMKRDVIEYINTCKSCNERKTLPKDSQHVPMQLSFTPSRPFQHVAMDIVGPLPITKQGNKFLLTFQDVFTKYPEAIAIPDQQVNTIAQKFVNNIICRHGCPESLTTDQGTNFTSAMFSEICKLLEIKQIQTTAYHPEANGVVERSHRTLMNYLSHFVNNEHSDWDEWIDLALMAYRATPHTATGYSPFFLTHGREANLPTEVIRSSYTEDYSEEDYIQQVVKGLKSAFNTAESAIKQNKARSKEYYDKTARQKEFNEGDLVLLYDPSVKRGRSKKLKRPWLGPYKIISKQNEVNYKIKKGRKEYITHVNRLKPFRLRALSVE